MGGGKWEEGRERLTAEAEVVDEEEEEEEEGAGKYSVSGK